MTNKGIGCVSNNRKVGITAELRRSGEKWDYSRIEEKGGEEGITAKLRRSGEKGDYSRIEEKWGE